METSTLTKSVLLIGVQDSGKTNFLSRFWLHLKRGNGILSADGIPEDFEYLNNISDCLLRGEFVPHTPRDVHETISIRVKSKFGYSGSLVVPDLSGEQIITTFRNREWNHLWEDRIDSGSACLIFVRVDSSGLVAPLDWLSCSALFNGTVPISMSGNVQSSDATIPTQVVLVDWLQFLRKAFTDKVNGLYRPRVGIVVGAWDIVPEEQVLLGPEMWVRSNLPMLWQYCQANSEEFQFEYFGVSIANGDLKTDPDFKETYLNGDPSSAGQVVGKISGNLQATDDMTLPVAWALGIYE